MAIKKKLIILLLLVITFIGSFIIPIKPVEAANRHYIENHDVDLGDSKQNAVSEYAAKWADNKNMPYVYGGPVGRGQTLEEGDKNHSGVDCSGFVSAVYDHFGIAHGGATDAAIWNAAKKKGFSIDEAVPGDAVRWDGHIALYMGNGIILHTNNNVGASNPATYIHYADYNYWPGGQFCRLVDDVSKYGAISNSVSKKVKENASNSSTLNNIITENDLTGMPIEASVKFQDKVNNISFANRSNLSETDIRNMSEIKENLYRQNKFYGAFGTVITFIGLFLIIYSLLLIIAFIFDYSNNWLDFSLLSILTLGKVEIVDSTDPVGHNKMDHKYYLTVKMVLIRAMVVLAVGVFFVSGYCSVFVTWIMQFFIKAFGKI